jgi:putative intracellular protease/amidase
MGDTGENTGVWFEELSTPYYAFLDGGASVDIASILGGPAPVEPKSQKALGENSASVDRFLRDKEAQAKLANTKKIAASDWQNYDAIFLPGGHGTMWDLPQSEELAKLLTDAFASHRVVAAVCHGPVGLVNAKAPDGRPLVAGRKVSAFTNSEEDAVGLTPVVPFLLETRLRELGGIFERGRDFEPYAVADGNLVTGQNPASSEQVAELVLTRLSEKGAVAA